MAALNTVKREQRPTRTNPYRSDSTATASGRAARAAGVEPNRPGFCLVIFEELAASLEGGGSRPGVGRLRHAWRT